MKLLQSISRAMAAAALVGTLVVPVASATPDRGDRRAHHDGHRGDRGYRGHRGDRGYRGDHHRGHRDRGHHSRHDRGYRNHRGYARHGYRNHYRDRGYRHARRHYRGYHAPRYYRHAPRYSRHYGHYGHRRSHYSSRYRVGGHYHVHPRTVVVRNYHHYGLYDPPYGHHWVHDHGSGDAVLRSVATGAVIGLVVGAIIAD